MSRHGPADVVSTIRALVLSLPRESDPPRRGEEAMTGRTIAAGRAVKGRNDAE